MRTRIHAWLAVIAVLAPALASAAGTCYQWTVNTPMTITTYYNSPQAALSAEMSKCNESNANKSSCTGNLAWTCTGTGVSCILSSTLIAGTWPAHTFKIQVERDAPSGHTSGETSAYNLTSRVNPEGCPECAAQGTEATLDGASGAAPSSTCVNGCTYSRSGPYINFDGSLSGLAGYIGSYKSAGTACSQVSTGPNTQASENDCKATSTDVYCMVKNQSGENCGQVNGEWFCAKSTKPGACTSTESGGAVCGSNRTDGKTETPPGPDSGTAGDPATPTVSVKDDATGRVTNYYNSSTVNGSTSGSSSSSSSGGSSSSSSSGGSSSSSSSSATCTGDCEFDAPENEAVGTVAETGNGFVARLYNAPIVAAVSSISTSLPAGVCPQGTVSLFGTSITMDMHCTLMADISSVISAVMLACWCFLGLRILMTA